jgi:hypothetical protein
VYTVLVQVKSTTFREKRNTTTSGNYRIFAAVVPTTHQDINNNDNQHVKNLRGVQLLQSRHGHLESCQALSDTDD